MKFLVKGNHLARGETMMRICLLLGLFMILLGWVTNLLIFVEKMGFSVTSVLEYYRGNEEEFRTPVSYLGLLEGTHFHLFSVVVILILLNHLAIFSGLSTGLKYVLIFSSFFSAMANIISGWLIVYVGGGFAILKLVAFGVFQLSTGSLIILVAYTMLTQKRSQSPHGS